MIAAMKSVPRALLIAAAFAGSLGLAACEVDEGQQQPGQPAPPPGQPAPPPGQ